MRILLDYGRRGLEVDLPESHVVRTLSQKTAAPLSDPVGEIERLLRQPFAAAPLGELAAGKKNACVVICDITRPVPNELILPPLLAALEQAGIRRRNILILVATGLHRPNLGRELEELVGSWVYQNYRIENHDAHALDQQTYLGESPRGVPIWMDTRYLESDLKITTGLIEPHLMAGFSGGRKVICPGIAGLETIRHWHSPAFLEHPRADCGCLQGNPVHEENTWIARQAGCDFIINAVLDERLRPLMFVAGDMEQAFLEGVRFVREVATDCVARPVDIVVTSSAGYPLDTTFYQSVKGMTAALPIVKPGGTIVLAASMSEGIGSPQFQRLLEEFHDLDDFMRAIQAKDFFVVDQWQLEELAKVRRKATVKVVTDGLSAEVLSQLFVEPSPSVEAAVAESLAQHGPEATIAVIPKGPYVLAGVEGRILED